MCFRYTLYYSGIIIENLIVQGQKIQRVVKIAIIYNRVKNLTVMKNKILLLSAVLLFTCILSGCNNEKAKESVDDESNTTTVFSSPDLKEITSKWVKMYSLHNPEARIQLIEVPEASISEYIDQNRSIGFLSETYTDEVVSELKWKETIGREVIVAIVSENNPFLDELKQRGISISELSGIISEPEMNNWNILDDSWDSTPVNLYIADNPFATAGIKNVFEAEEADLSRAKIIANKRMIVSVKFDPSAIGFCSLNDIIDYGVRDITDGIMLLPIDRNENGRIDNTENFYGSLEDFGRGVWLGKYPGALSRDIYSVSAAIPSTELERSFMRWILTNGQFLLNNHGYSDLMASERLAKLNILREIGDIGAASNTYSTAKHSLSFYIFFPVVFTVLVVIYLFVFHSTRYLKEKKEGFIPGIISSNDIILNKQLLKSPQGLYYDKTHTWAFMEKDGIVKIGIDDFLQNITGPITSIKVKEPGQRVRKGNQIVSISQNGKQLDLNSSISGTIIEYNEKVIKDTSIINASPFVEGWIYKIEPTNWIKEIQFMLTGSGYRGWLQSELNRFKDFLANTLRSTNIEYSKVLQDGGEIKIGILKDFGPRVWEDFQSDFIDITA
jgi:glycine cleavage system H lipoate-binding protein/ABC-type phosphate transport system substrate-binding protein